MSDNFKFVQAQAFILAGAGVILGDTEVTLSSFEGIDGDLLTMSDFGTKGFATLEPNSSSQEEQISFTGVTQNANGTATLTGVSNVLFISPYTETSGFAKTHSGGVKLVITNTSGFYNTFANRLDDETITGTWTFTQPNYPRMDNVFVFPTDPQQLVPKAYADSLTFAGAPNASTSVQGLVQEATVAELNAGTATGSTGAVLFGSPADFAASIYGLQLPTSGQKSALAGDSGTPGSGNTYMTQIGFQKGTEIYAASSAGTDTYAITLSPALTVYTVGQVFRFKADVGNTGAATLNVNGVGALNILDVNGSALVTGVIVANQIVEVVVYDATNAKMLSPSAALGVVPASYKNGTTTKNAADASTTQNIAHGLGKIPTSVTINALIVNSSDSSRQLSAQTIYNGTTQSSLSIYEANGPAYTLDTTFTLNASNTTSTQTGVVTFDATNIIITWTKTTTPSGTYTLLWQAIG